MRLARCTVSGEWLRVRSRKYIGAPGGVKIDRGTGSSQSRAVNQSVGGGDDIPDKLALAAPLGSLDRLYISGIARRPIAGRGCRSGARLLPVRRSEEHTSELQSPM